MIQQKTDFLELLEYIDPVGLEYQQWVNIGMALKEEGYSADDWDNWSRKDPARYHPGECRQKWKTFNGCSRPVTGGTIVRMAAEAGWKPEYGSELDWDDIIEADAEDGDPVRNRRCAGENSIKEPSVWNPARELIRYLETLFDPAENVSYVTGSWERDGRYMPKRENHDRTAGQLIERLSHCGGDIGSVIGDYNPQAGAWIRFNPVDGKRGKGGKDENVTDFRYALVETDDDGLGVDAQYDMLRRLELPVACLVYSGNKSLHAIVRVDADDRGEYRRRVEYLYDVCRKNGFNVDGQNRNPSRLSRMPGVERSGKKQFIVDTNIGRNSWKEWYDWIEDINDDLPEPESLDSVWDNLPELAEPLIEGVLRKGHKMLIAGPSKAGKSFALIELCCAIAEGRPWLGWHCTQGRVMYVNLELDRASCLHRFKDVYQALGWVPQNSGSIDIWNLRGKSVPMDRLAPKLIRRASRKDYTAIVIDPIYKVITGDENSADQMAAFCNQFDKVCTELGCAVIYCHHHSKGAQGGKRSMDRASGSGVFARDPDALIDLIELELTEAVRKQEENKAVCAACRMYLDKWEDELSQDDLCSSTQMMAYCEKKLDRQQMQALMESVNQAKEKTRQKTAWRIEGTLREFPKFEPVNLWFSYPVHQVDRTGILSDIQPEAEKPPWKKGAETNKKNARERKEDRKKALEEALAGSNFGDIPTVKDVADYLGISVRTARDRINEHGGYVIEDGNVKKKE